MGAFPGTREFACPHCQSSSGSECITAGGRRCAPHRARLTRRQVWIRTGGEFVVRVLKTDDRLALTADELYIATAYWLDPGKVTLLRRVDDGFNPECNQYAQTVEFVSMVTAVDSAARRKWATERLAETFTPHLATGEDQQAEAAPRETHNDSAG